MGNELNECKYSLKEEESKLRSCGKNKKDIRDVFEDCKKNNLIVNRKDGGQRNILS